MAKTELHPQLQSQPASPKKSKSAVNEPELIAGPEVIGREISVFQGSIKNPEWWDGRIVEFKPESAQHLVRYHREHRSEHWISLNGQPFQWKGSLPPTAAPNPSVKGIRLNDSLLGRKVKVFWPAMSKWYLGCIKEYDPHANEHTIKYKDGEVKIHALRHEAVWWLDTADTRTPSSPKSRGHSTSARTANAHATAKHQSHSSGRTCTSGGSSGRHALHQHSTTAETSHQQSVSDLQAPASRAKLEDRAKTGAKSVAGAKASAAAERDCHSGVFAAASGNADTDAENGYASQHSRRPDAAGESPSAMQDEEEQMQDHVPSVHGSNPNPSAKPSRMATLRQGRARDWTKLAADSKGRRSATPRAGEPRGPLDEPGAGDALFGARVGIFWEDDETFYKGQLAGFDAYHKRSKVSYDDGQEEWISLAKERFRWFTPRGRTSKHFNPHMKAIMQQLGAIDLASDPTPNVPPPDPTQTLVPETGAQADSASTQQPAVATALPQGTTAVGWGLSIYSHAEEAWVQGQVLSWSSRQGQHHVLYEDGEDEWLKLGEEHVRWHHHKCNISRRAGLQKGRKVPEGLAAVGWRVGVYWTDDQKFYMGEIAAYNDEEDEYEINYDDNEKEDICLREQPIKWLLPPGLSTTGGAPDTLRAAGARRLTATHLDSVKMKRRSTSRRHGQDHGLDKQRSRLGLSRRSTGIQKASAALSKSAALSVRPHAQASPSLMMQQVSVPSQSVATDPVDPGPTAATAVAASEPGMAPAVATWVPLSAGLGSSATPHIDRVIALGSRRAPHLAGTRVKIYCSQVGRGIKSRHSLSSTVGGDSGYSRRVKQKVEALDLMIWRCECARKVITKGAPIPASSLSGQDMAQPQSLGPTAPVAGIIANQVAAGLGATQGLPANNVSAPQTLPTSTSGGNQAPAATQLPAYNRQNQQPAGNDSEVDPHMQLQGQRTSDQGELIYQLPSSAPLLTEADSALLTHISPVSSEPQHYARPAQLSAGQDMPSGAGLSHSSLQVPPHSPSSSPANPSPAASCQSSPSSASLAGLIPPTTAVTVSSLTQPPYNMISAARAASLREDIVPAVMPQVAAQTSMPAAFSARPDADGTSLDVCNGNVPVRGPLGMIMGSLRPELLSQLPVLKGVLRAQSSIRLPPTPDSESLERHAALRREHSSFSRSSAMDKLLDGPDIGQLQRKEAVSTAGLLDLAMSTALPAGDLEPDMFAAFFEDSGAFDRPDPAV